MLKEDNGARLVDSLTILRQNVIKLEDETVLGCHVGTFVAVPIFSANVSYFVEAIIKLVVRPLDKLAVRR